MQVARVNEQRSLTRDEVINTCGPLDDTVVAKIIAFGVTAEELAQARAWLESDEPLISSGKHLASGRVGRLVEILASVDEELNPNDR